MFVINLLQETPLLLGKPIVLCTTCGIAEERTYVELPNCLNLYVWNGNAHQLSMAIPDANFGGSAVYSSWHVVNLFASWHQRL